MTGTIRWALTAGLLCGICQVGTANAESNDRLLKLLQLQTLNRMASDAAPTKKNPSRGDSTHEDPGADRRGSEPQQNNPGTPGRVPARNK